MLAILLLLSISAWYGWRYSKTDIDPDWAMFNLGGFTGSKYGRDFADCKTAGVHLWYLMLVKIVGKSVPRVKFIHHALLGMAGIGVYLLSGSFWNGLAFTVLINSGWLLAFHGNVGQVPAALIALSFTLPPWMAIILWALTVFYEPKLILTFLLMFLFKSWWVEWPTLLALLCGGGLIMAYLALTKQWKGWWESSVTIPGRMAKARKIYSYPWVPWFTASGFLYLLPWAALAVAAKPDVRYWLPAAAYLIFSGMGKVLRPNHFIPLVAWIAGAGIAPWMVLMLCVVDWTSAGFYLGDIWGRFYLGLRDLNQEAQRAGEWLKDKAGSIWVNGIHTGIYIYAQKPVNYGLAEQIEIREVAHERRAEMVKRWKSDPPAWVVMTQGAGVKFNATGYVRAERFGSTEIWRKQNGSL